jgi:hypothetical protein
MKFSSRGVGRRHLLVMAAVLVVFGASASGATAAIVPTTSDATGATAIAGTLDQPSTVVTGASYDSVPPNGTPNGISNGPFSFFPTNGSSFGILTSGDVNIADDANTSASSTADDGGGNVRGNTDFDVSVLKVNLAVPLNVNCMRVDFAFYSEEFPEFVGSAFNDAFIAELDSSNWATSGSNISASNNFAFDQNGNPISINTSGATAMSAANATGTTYDGATPLLVASTPVTPGTHTLYLSIFDQGDRVLDSAAFIDNLRFASVANPSTDCKTGATTKPPEDCTNQTDDDGDNLVDGQDPDCNDNSEAEVPGDSVVALSKKLSVPLTCLSRKPCTGVVSLTAPLGHKMKGKSGRRQSVRIGYRRYRIRAGRTVSVRVPIAANRLRQLKRAKKARVRVKARATAHTRRARALRPTFVVKVKRAKRH